LTMKSIETLQLDAETEIEKEKEQTIKEVFKELLVNIHKSEEEIKEAKQHYEDAIKTFADARTDKNVLMKLCLKKVVSHPVKAKD
jgi:hypothetical protein